MFSVFIVLLWENVEKEEARSRALKQSFLSSAVNFTRVEKEEARSRALKHNNISHFSHAIALVEKEEARSRALKLFLRQLWLAYLVVSRKGRSPK